MVNKTDFKSGENKMLKTGPDIRQLIDDGYRRTPQRLKVLEILRRYADQYLNGEEIFRLARQEYPGIGLATVYRTLTLLEKLNRLSVLPTTDNGNLYQLATGSERNGNCRMICRKCGRVEECPAQPRWQAEFSGNGFLIEEVSINGICRECLLRNG